MRVIGRFTTLITVSKKPWYAKYVPHALELLKRTLEYPKFAVLKRWLDENLEKNPLKCEYFLPLVVSELIGEKKAAVKVLRSTDKWYGVTYREDKPVVVEAIAKKTADGLYPENLWA